MEVGALTCCALLLSVCDLKAAQENAQPCLIQEFLLYKVELGHNTMEAAKNIRWVKGEGVVDQCIVSRWFKDFRSGYQKLDNRVKLVPVV